MMIVQTKPGVCASQDPCELHTNRLNCDKSPGRNIQQAAVVRQALARSAWSAATEACRGKERHNEDERRDNVHRIDITMEAKRREAHMSSSAANLTRL